MKPKTLTKEILDNLREKNGFPIGKDEDIIRFSKPPYYIACPNPWMDDFINKYSLPYNENEDDYFRKPFTSDVSEGKNELIYRAHSYHTKVPYKAIMRYILHYTNPNDIVYDGFCGTGMTGIACQLCGNKETIEGLGYQVDSDNRISENKQSFSKLGLRYAILNDLSPASTFISYVYNNGFSAEKFEKEAKKIIAEIENKFGWMYETQHVIDGKIVFKSNIQNLKKEPIIGKINYTVWSDVFICPFCNKEIIFWDIGINKETGKIIKEFLCPYCKALLTKNKMQRALETVYDKELSKSITRAKQIPVLINYSIEKIKNNKIKWIKYEKKLDELDIKKMEKINNFEIPYWYPITELPKGYNTKQPLISHGLSHIHHFFTKRALIVTSAFFHYATNNHICSEALRFLFQSLILGYSKINRYVPTHYSQVNQYLNGTLYVASLNSEVSLRYAFAGKIERIVKAFKNRKIKGGSSIISTQSATSIDLADSTIDYIFIDPPFGNNLMYSELNFIWESWLQIFTNNKNEAIMNKVQGKGLLEYKKLMEESFKENFRILKPDRWMTVEFHNSKNSIWNAIQDSIQKAGFIIADMRVLDKKAGTFKQITTTSSVKKDLIISAYKPKVTFERSFLKKAIYELSVWDFIKQHLEHLPIVVIQNGKMEIISERQKYLLFDRMVIYYFQHGFKVPISSGDFYKGLDEKFPERDGMYFLPHQVSKYEKKRIQFEGPQQLQLFVSDEKSAIIWLKSKLHKRQTYQDIFPKFLQQMKTVHKYEKMPELLKILEENFLKDNNECWYIPDYTKESDLEKIRNTHLIKEFKEYIKKRSKLKKFRMEAIRAGFRDAWEKNNYTLIVDIAKSLPSNVIQEDPDLLMYYDNALLMIPK